MKVLSEKVLAAVTYYRQVRRAQSSLNTTNAHMQTLLDDLSTEEFEQWKEATVIYVEWGESSELSRVPSITQRRR